MKNGKGLDILCKAILDDVLKITTSCKATDSLPHSLTESLLVRCSELDAAVTQLREVTEALTGAQDALVGLSNAHDYLNMSGHTGEFLSFTVIHNQLRSIS